MNLQELETVFIRDYNALIDFCIHNDPRSFNNVCLVLRKWLFDNNSDNLKEASRKNEVKIQYNLNRIRVSGSGDRANLIWLSLGDALWCHDPPRPEPKYALKIERRAGNLDSFLNSKIVVVSNPKTSKIEFLTVKGLIKASCYLGAIHTGGVTNKIDVSIFLQEIIKDILLGTNSIMDNYTFVHYDIRAISIVVLYAWWDLYAHACSKRGLQKDKNNIFNCIHSKPKNMKMALRKLTESLQVKKIKVSTQARKDPLLFSLLKVEIL